MTSNPHERARAGRVWGRRTALLSVSVALAWLTLPAISAAQRPVPRPAQDTTRADTARQGRIQPMTDPAGRRPGRRGGQQDSLPTPRIIPWQPLDSVMSELIARPGFRVTRYQGDSVRFQAQSRTIELIGEPSVVSRDSATLAGDTIEFNDSTKIIIARGDTLLLRDPAQGQDDIIALGSLRYDIERRHGVVRNVTTTVESGEKWIVHGDIAAFRGDTTADGASAAAFYARNGWLTSCLDPEPHYHFAARELKMVAKNIMVARPAILYIADIPVAWLPFVFQDMRAGRRSGIIPPRIGFSDIVRNSASYRRTVEDLGYYFALNDYFDLRVAMDWRSHAGAGSEDPGWIRLNGQMSYRWLDRFIDGELGYSYHYLRSGETNKEYSLSHRQKFSERTRLTADVRYATNTTVIRNTTFNPFQALGTIRSSLNYSTGRGPFSIQIGGSQTQYSGREEINQDFPSINVTSRAIRAGDWLSWTPSFQFSSSRRLNIDQAGDFRFLYQALPGGGIRDSTPLDRDSYTTRMSFDTPLELWGYNLRNSFRFDSRMNDFPEKRIVYASPNDTSTKSERVFRRTFVDEFNWEPSFALPSFAQSRWNISPSVQLQKIDPRGGLFVRTERTGGKWVAQSFRPSVGLSMAPTFYGFFPGFGPISRIRHSIAPTLSYSYVPKAEVSDEFLAAYGDTRVGYLGANRQNVVTLGLNTTFEAKLRGAGDADTTLGAGMDNAQKIKLLSINFTSLAYDFERARATGKTGLATPNFGYTVRSDLLPGVDVGVDYSLFQGDPISDTAVFKPYRERVSAQLSLGATSPIVRGLARMLGFAPPGDAPPGGQAPTRATDASAQFGQRSGAARPITGSVNTASLQIPQGQGWQLSLSYSASRQRAPVGGNVVDVDPTAQCESLRQLDPFSYETCVRQYSSQVPDNGSLYNQTTRGGTGFRFPPQQTMQGNLSFHLTDKWAARWSTTYDFEEGNFASQIVSLQRELHDWDAVFAFTKAPNGNFAFNFFIALRAQPDLKFNYDRRDYPRGYTGRRVSQ